MENLRHVNLALSRTPIVNPMARMLI